MEAQPPEDISALLRAITELSTQVAQVQKELSEIKQVTALTQVTLESYSANPGQCQEQSGAGMPINEEKEEYYSNNKRNPPFVPEGTQLTCIRCRHKWTPHARRPQLCPACKTPWWFPPRWKWHQGQTQSQESYLDK